jgi:hypothetical protein
MGLFVPDYSSVPGCGRPVKARLYEEKTTAAKIKNWVENPAPG